jgi:mono/diheme cytochrome c family protein
MSDFSTSRRVVLVLTVTLLSLQGSLNAQTATERPSQFNRDIRPILSENCFACHGPDASHRQADLRLDDREAAVAAKAIVPGETDQSTLIERVFSTDPQTIMPPPGSHKSLTPAQQELLRRWISEGAVYQKHWSYEPPQKASIEAGRNAVDVLVRRRLDEVGLKPSAEADRRTLIRRLSFDLLGLPPTAEDVRRFVDDSSDNAYERLVDRLLASPHYGERMAIGWLDVVRFADTIGYHSDNPRNIWPYRDWVIRSFNDNKPFDQFTVEQIAGDLLPDATQETRIGSAFNRLLLTTEEGGAQPKDYEARMLTDRVRAVGAAWLGQTTGCAQCHDHKFDPFTTRDFYTLGAFFADIKENAIGRREDGMPILTPDQQAQLDQLDAKIKEARQSKQKDAIEAAQKAHKDFLQVVPTCLVSESTTEKRTVRILPRGNWMDESGEVVQPAVPHYLPQPDVSGRELDRLDLAQWLVSRNNPLTARTIMNRLWKQFFGTGLSKVLEDLGAQGELPLNQPLLDWLACEFMDSGWDTKHMVRLIVTSHTYLQVSTVTPELMAVDPYDREHARQSRFRLDAELIRDNVLTSSGLLNRTIGGPSVKPCQPDGYWENLNFPTREYVADSGDSQYRRGLYVWWQRSFLHPSLLAFDAPSREECVSDRSRSNIPQQALTLMNDPSYVEAFRAFAARAIKECSVMDQSAASKNTRITWMWQQALQRTPTKSELATMRALVDQQREAHQANPDGARQLMKIGQSSVPESIDPVELAAWTHVARVLLNLHESITRN